MPAIPRGSIPAFMALLFAAAFVSSLFFNGYVVPYFSAAQIALMVCAGIVLWDRYDAIAAPRTPLALVSAGFAAWLVVTLAWTPALHVSVLNAWWLGALPLTFWLYTLSEDQERLWRAASALLLAAVLVLAVIGIYESLVEGVEPRAAFLNLNSQAALLAVSALPVAAAFLRMMNAGRSRWAGALAAALFVLVMALSLTGGRGAFLGFLIGFIVLLGVSWRHTSARARGILIAVTLVAVALGQLSATRGMLTRLGTLAHPEDASFTRWVIWEGAWRLLHAHPLRGVGLGVFWLVFPPYRLPADSSAGYYVHNDYLQFWIEAGLPGLLLLLGVMAAVLAAFVHLARDTTKPIDERIEASGLFAALLALGGHAFVDFDLYTLPLLLLAGLACARLHRLAYPTPPAVVFHPARWFRSLAYRALLVAVLALPGVYFVAIALAERDYGRGLTAAGRGDYIAADTAFRRAERLSPGADNLRMTHADMLRLMLAATRGHHTGERALVFADARHLLDAAIARNPVRAQTYFVRAQLYEQNRALTGPDWREQVVRAYEDCLKRDPRFFPARVAYARFLEASGDLAAARAVLDAGISYWYYPNASVLEYYAMATRLRAEAGDSAGAAAVRTKIQAVEEAMRAAAAAQRR